MGFFMSIIIGILAGFIAEKFMKSNGGMWTNLFVGCIGGVLGWWVVKLLGLTYIQPDKFLDSVVVSACGAILLLAIWRYFKGTKPA